MSKGNLRGQDDYLAAGFCVEGIPIALRPPKIRWGDKYQTWDDARKVEYLEKLADGINEALSLLQKERNELGRLCELKEKQVQSMNEAVRQNNMMLQSEVTRLNSDRQQMLAEVAKLQARVRELEA